MLPEEWLGREDIWDKVERVLEDVDAGVTFPANRDAAEADAVTVECFSITKRIRGKDSPNAWYRIKEDKDVAVAERGEELVLEGVETKGSPCDSNMATTLFLLELLICLSPMEITQKTTEKHKSQCLWYSNTK